MKITNTSISDIPELCMLLELLFSQEKSLYEFPIPLN